MDPNNKQSLKGIIHGLLPCLLGPAASPAPTTTLRTRCISLIKSEFQIEFALFQCRSILWSMKGGNRIEFECKINAGNRVKVAGEPRGRWKLLGTTPRLCLAETWHPA